MSTQRQRLITACWDDGHKAGVIYECARIQKAQADALRTLGRLVRSQASCLAACGGNPHLPNCPEHIIANALRQMRGATRRPR